MYNVANFTIDNLLSYFVLELSKNDPSLSDYNRNTECLS